MRRPEGGEAEFVFFATRVEHLNDPARQFTLSAEDIALLNPVTKTCPIFRSRRDADITKAIYRRIPVLVASGWKLDLRRLLNSADDSGNFLDDPAEGRLPLYEGKYFHHYNHRWVTNEPEGDRPLTDNERDNPAFAIRPRHWYPAHDAYARFSGRWRRSWVLAWRDITNATNERTFIATVVPSLAVPDTANVMDVPQELIATVPALIANLGSIALDFAARQKVGGMHMSAFIVGQLPVLPAATYDASTCWSVPGSLYEWILPRVLELTYTAWDLEHFAREIGYEGPPFHWNPERRFLLRCELDAAFFHLYGISHEDVDYVMDTFPIVRRNDEKAYSEYRTKRVILEIYDAMARSAQTGKPYVTLVDPPPGTPGASHGTFALDGTPRDYAEALRTGLLFSLIRNSGDAGISTGTLSRALVWLQDPGFAKAWLEGAALTEFEGARDADTLIAAGAADSQALKLLDALETAKAITRDAKGIVRPSTSGTIPNWLPQTSKLSRLASAMRGGLERAERGADASLAAENGRSGRGKVA